MSRDRRAWERMVERAIRRRGVKDERVLAAMREVPREAFLDPEFRRYTAHDGPIPIGEGQTTSQPYIIAAMAQAARLEPTDRVLEVGTGHGYAAAILARLAARVYTIERHAALADRARRVLADLGVDNVEVRCGDGTRGWPEEAPFDAIIVAAGAPAVPETLKAQLAVGGRLVLPVGPMDRQRCVRITRLAPDRYEEKNLGRVQFVPLVGEEGWPDDGGIRFVPPLPER